MNIKLSKYLLSLIILTFFTFNFAHALTGSQTNALKALLKAFEDATEQVADNVSDMFNNIDKTSTDTQVKNHASTYNNEQINCQYLQENAFVPYRKNNAIKEVQRALRNLGLFDYPVITNFYGPVTIRAVQDFQCKHLSLCSGSVYSNGYGLIDTRTKLKLCSVLKNQTQEAKITNNDFSRISKQSCTLDGVTVQEGKGKIFFSTQKSFLCDIYASYRICKNGKLSGSNQYKYSRCTRPDSILSISDFSRNSGTKTNNFNKISGNTESNNGHNNNNYKWRVEQTQKCSVDGVITYKVTCVDSRDNPVASKFCYKHVKTLKPPSYKQCTSEEAKNFVKKMFKILTNKNPNNKYINETAKRISFTPIWNSQMTPARYVWETMKSKSFSNTHGNVNKMSPHVFGKLVYNLFLDRAPTNNELNNLIKQMEKDGVPKSQIVKEILLSPEFKQKHKNLTATGLLNESPIYKSGPFKKFASGNTDFSLNKDKVLLAYFYPWHDIYSGAHIRYKEHGDILTTHPASYPEYKNPPFSYLEKDWWKKELQDMADAGIDVALVSTWVLTDIRFAGTGNFIKAFEVARQAMEELEREGKKFPKFGILMETAPYASFEYNFNQQYPNKVMQKSIYNVLSRIPSKYWARIDGKIVLVFWAGGGNPFQDTENMFIDLKKHIKQNLNANLLVLNNHPKGYKIWQKAKTDGQVRWDPFDGGASITGKFAQVRPGFDNSNGWLVRTGKRKKIVVSREDGALYERGWQKIMNNPKVKMVFVETWNEYHEGRDISHSYEYGYKYINLTKEFANKWKNTQ